MVVLCSRFRPKAASPTWAFALILAVLGVSAAEAKPGIEELRVIESTGFADTRVLEEIAARGSAPVLIAFDSETLPPGAVRQLRVAPRREGRHEKRAKITAAGDALLRAFGRDEFRPRHRMRSVSALAGDIDARGLVRLFRNPSVISVAYDHGGSGQLAESLPLAKLDVLQGLSITGSGQTVAVVDSGVDTDHIDLSSSLAAERCFCNDNGAGCCPDGSTSQSGTGSAEDDHGHGTNVTGIVASDGFFAPTGGAPDADVVAVKVLDSSNEFCCLSDVILALDYIHVEHPEVAVVNMSLGTFALYPGECDLADVGVSILAVVADALRDDGVVLVASSLNDGSSTEMGAPACLSSVVAVGAVYDDDLGSQTTLGCTDLTTAVDQIPCWSNTNSETDLLAPGARVTSTGFTGGTSNFSGTSQAAPLVAACAALLLEADPLLTPAEVEAALVASTTLVFDARNGLTFPRLDCEEAFESLGFGECADFVDNDGDGLIDHPEDLGCDDGLDASEQSPLYVCDDGIDNDLDGLVDIAEDPGCFVPFSGKEDPACDDGVDNDGDTLIDWDGAGVGDPDPYCTTGYGVREKPSSSSCGLGPLPVALSLVTLAGRGIRRSRGRRQSA